ncbi:ferritin-like domain-containing protein [Dichomitus squalens]|uniref:Ferritin-like domain-containing protein n=1 Tax=Dichomitus squalens TaxID=114155 RepID=A0A4Q9PXT3_9APHY|nr:ferritin-like domain-containing protein [Dichomitus squalens]TBU59415.1 ferritin-like domain-containing protein [Dichomitus squalens]
MNMFKRFFLVGLTALAAAVSAAPAPSAATDIQILQFALTLEHIENTFYNTALAKFTAKDFENAGYPDWVRSRFVQIAGHEATHVKYLTETLGSNAVPFCEYDFGTSLDDPTAFAKMSRVFETVGTSAYLGGASLLQNKAYLTAAASILGVEISQAGWVSSSVLKVQPWSGPFNIPLAASAAFSLAQPFIKSCPPGYPQLPVKELPSLTLSNTQPALGDTINLSFPNADFNNGTQYYAAWLDGLTVQYTDINANGGSTKVPNNLQGIVYVAIVSSKETPSDDNLVSGLALIAYDFDSKTNNTVSGSPV